MADSWPGASSLLSPNLLPLVGQLWDEFWLGRKVGCHRLVIIPWEQVSKILQLVVCLGDDRQPSCAHPMTIETKTSIELSDVESIEFQCEGCGAKVVYPVQSFKGPPIRCSVCPDENQKQWLVPGNQDFSALVALGQTLQLFSGPSKPKGFKLHLCLANLPTPSGETRHSTTR